MISFKLHIMILEKDAFELCDFRLDLILLLDLCKWEKSFDVFKNDKFVVKNYI